MPQTQGPIQNLGPTGQQVAANVQRLRGAMTYRELADRLAELGRPISVLGLSRIENGARRVDADDLVALAVALGVSPVALLLPHDAGDVDLTSNYTTGWQAAWRWACGDVPLIDKGGQLDLRDPSVGQFIRESRPYEESRAEREVARYLIARVPSPFTAEIQHDGVRTRARLTFGDVDLDDGGE